MSRAGHAVITRRDVLKCSVGAAALGAAPVALSAQPVARIGLATDCHYAAVEVRGNRFYRQSLDKLTECVDEMNRQGVDALVELGDFKDQDNPVVEANTLEYLRTIETAFRRFHGPRFHVLGNHDVDSISKEQFQSVVSNTGIPRDKTWYSFDAGGVHGIVLDANFSDKGVPHDSGRFKWSEAFIPHDQLTWLAADLKATKLPVLVFVHQRLDVNTQFGVSNGRHVRQILEASRKVLAVFQGHYHEGSHTHIHGIHYYTLKAVVDNSGPENSAYAIAEVGANGDVTVTGYRKAVSVRMG